MHQLNTPSIIERSVLASLRALVPQRPLTPSESLRIAELQANRLLQHFQIETVAVPEEIISELPRIRVEYESQLPISGSAHWNGRHWIITLSADEPCVRQRFSLAHEFKHILDHTTRQWLYRNGPLETAEQQAERVADYFAACLLMPKRVVKRLWYRGHQNIVELAERLRVSTAAARYRLDQLGIVERSGRCGISRVTAGRRLTLKAEVGAGGNR